jgi:hypothetical protein
MAPPNSGANAALLAKSHGAIALVLISHALRELRR